MSKNYKVGAAGAFRDGVLYKEGEIISIPDDEKPSKTWAPVDVGAAPAVPKVAEVRPPVTVKKHE